VTKVGWDASMNVSSVVTPLTWLYVPVRIDARLGAHSEFVAKRLSRRTPVAAMASMCGVRLTTDP
jgi:hypothetical protein